jgi:hypothetical protein
MKSFRKLIIFTIIFIPSLSNAATGHDINRFDWHKLKIAFESYVNYPTGANAAKVSALLPKNTHVKYTNETQEQDTLTFIRDASQLDMLERQVISGDREAVRLAFNLFAVADGGFAGDLSIMLGSLIRVHPKLFLDGLSEFPGLMLPIGALVGNPGYEFVDRIEARCYEYQLRIDSLKRVTEPKLKNLRDRCIEHLQKDINKYCK